MATPASGQPRAVEVIELLSDDSHDETDSDSDTASAATQPPRPRMLLDDEFAPWNQPPIPARTPTSDNDVAQGPTTNTNSLPARGGAIVHIDGEEIFIPDEKDEEDLDTAALDRLAEAATAHDPEIALALQETGVTTFDDCLSHVLEIFPDISHEHVQALYNEFDHTGGYEMLPPQARLDNIIEQLVSSPFYPKQDKGKKRKREQSLGEPPKNRWENQDRAQLPPSMRTTMRSMLKAEFPGITMQYINDTLAAERHLYHAYVHLARTQDVNDGTSRPYGRGRPRLKQLADAETIAATAPWPDILDELVAAREHVGTIRAERAAEEAKKAAEQENLNRAIAAGETAECSACYEDIPMNRQLHCNGPVAHFTCFECMERYIKSEVGDSRCRVLCPAGCSASFAHNQLVLLADKSLLEKLAQLQQEKDIRDADLDDLEECPFCDYKAILPPIEEDFEFRCANPDCERVSCRRCKAISHVPISCEQHAKDNKTNSRHKIEEAMTAALVRSCNKCKKQFIKEFGCNKMTCPSCGNLQCYVCSASLRDYNHFEQNHPRAVDAPSSSKSKACPLYDNVEERHEREVREAEAAARAQVVEENPDVTAEDLEIKVSDAVKQATATRIQRHGGGGMHAHVLGMLPPHLAYVGAANAFGVFDVAGHDGDAAGRARQRGRALVQARVRAEMANQRRERGRARHAQNNTLGLEGLQRQQQRGEGRTWRDAIQRDVNAGPLPPLPFPGQVQEYFPIGRYPGINQPQGAPQPAPPVLHMQPGQVQLPPNYPYDGLGLYGDDFLNNMGFFGDGTGDINPAARRNRPPPVGVPGPFFFDRNDIFGQQLQPAQGLPVQQVQAEQQMQQMVRDLGRLDPHQDEAQQQQPAQMLPQPQAQQQQQQEHYGFYNPRLHDQPQHLAFNPIIAGQRQRHVDLERFAQEQRRRTFQDVEAMEWRLQEQSRHQREWEQRDLDQLQHQPLQPPQPPQTEDEMAEQQSVQLNQDMDEMRGQRRMW